MSIDTISLISPVDAVTVTAAIADLALATTTKRVRMTKENVKPNTKKEDVPKKGPIVTASKKPANTPKRKKRAPTHPTYAEMIKMAITELKEKKGASRTAILKYITQNYNLGGMLGRTNLHLKAALKKGTKCGAFEQKSGTGAHGRFGLPKVVQAKKEVRKVVQAKKEVRKVVQAKKEVRKVVQAKKEVRNVFAKSVTNKKMIIATAAPTKKAGPARKLVLAVTKPAAQKKTVTPAKKTIPASVKKATPSKGVTSAPTKKAASAKKVVAAPAKKEAKVAEKKAVSSRKATLVSVTPKSPKVVVNKISAIKKKASIASPASKKAIPTKKAAPKKTAA
uniref:H15 domain-containing protein n=1 Tax=Rhabditophanes sp. KR3021 TaxID=114890 RepID=A0AC35U7Y5_9BILA